MIDIIEAEITIFIVSKYNLFCIVGQRGTTDNNLLKEQFIKLGLTVSYDGIWFVKRKYD